MELSVDTKIMNEKSLEMHTLCNELKDNMNNMKTVVFSAGDVWQGDAERAFEAKLLSVQRSFIDVVDSLENFADLLASFSTQYEEHDKELASKITYI